MTRFNTIKYNSATGTIEVGSGTTWDQVYAILNSTGANVIGGRVPSVGTAGLTMGGGA
jgi:FAD/FMN-containing dehydrogenase